MNINITFCGQLCETFNIQNVFRRNKLKLETIIKDINTLLGDENFDKRHICVHILNKLIQITQSEYGFIGRILFENGNYVLYTYAITNIAWNAASHQFFMDYCNRSLKFENMETLFGESIVSGKYTIVNRYDSSRNVLPKGHPRVKRFMGVPMLFGTERICFLGVCNKLSKYTKKDVNNVRYIMNLLSYLFIDISNGNHHQNTILSCPFMSSSISASVSKETEEDSS